LGEKKVTRRIVRLAAENILILMLLFSTVSAYQEMTITHQEPTTDTVINSLPDASNIQAAQNQTAITSTSTENTNNTSRISNQNFVSSQNYSPLTNQVTLTIKSTPNETVLLSAINALKQTGGIIVLENSLTIMSQDVLLQSNIELSGINPQITISLTAKNLQIAPNAQNVTVRNLTIDASNLGDRFGFVIGQNASNIALDNVAFQNYNSTKACLLNNGNNVTINKTSFTNVTQAYAIQINGSNVNVTNSNSNDNSIYSLVDVCGGLNDINIINNTAINRPLFWANDGTTPTKYILIENNTLYFPNATYGILVRGGVGDNFPVSDEFVIVKGNQIVAAPGAWNAIAIYGLTKNALVINNTVDMSLSGHNAISVSSGINVTVTSNTVYGSTEDTEGGIEVESNPVHNRAVGISENVTIMKNTVYNSTWGIYVRVMCPDHPNWNGTILLSKNIIFENNIIYGCNIGINLLHGEEIVVRNNNISSTTIPFTVDPTNVFNYTFTDNLDHP
jgi:parallel beta-helix repeat protein